MEMGDGGGIGRSENRPNIESAANIVKQGFDNERWLLGRPFNSMSPKRLRNKRRLGPTLRTSLPLQTPRLHRKPEPTTFGRTLTKLKKRRVNQSQVRK
jgi:hypothetical protein